MSDDRSPAMKKAKTAKKPATPAVPVNPFPTVEALSAMVRSGDADAKAFVVDMLKHCEGKITVLAKQLGVSARTIYNWRDNAPGLKKQFDKHAIGLEGAGRNMNAASVKAREAKAEA